MFWFTRPPYHRYLAAGLVVLSGLVMELRPAPLVMHPFLVRDVNAGATVTADDVEWRRVPVGLFRLPDLPAVAARPLIAGEPLLPSALGDSYSSIPPGWFGMELPVPADVGPGRRVLVVITPALVESDPSTVDGLVVGTVSDDGLGRSTALVAVPADLAASVAVGAAEGRVTVLVGAPEG